MMKMVGEITRYSRIHFTTVDWNIFYVFLIFFEIWKKINGGKIGEEEEEEKGNWETRGLKFYEGWD